MCEDQKFWLNWFVSFGSALFTFLAILVAIFGENIKRFFNKIKLSIELINPRGELTTIGNNPSAKKARFYHLKVVNYSKNIIANDTVINVIRIEEKKADGSYSEIWNGEIPLVWKNQEIYPVLRKISSHAFCDFIAVIENEYIELRVIYRQNNMKQQWTGNCHTRIVLQVKSLECISEEKILQIDWDGQWEDGELEMASHLIVK